MTMVIGWAGDGTLDRPGGILSMASRIAIQMDDAFVIDISVKDIKSMHSNIHKMIESLARFASPEDDIYMLVSMGRSDSESQPPPALFRKVYEMIIDMIQSKNVIPILIIPPLMPDPIGSRDQRRWIRRTRRMLLEVADNKSLDSISPEVSTDHWNDDGLIHNDGYTNVAHQIVSGLL